MVLFTDEAAVAKYGVWAENSDRERSGAKRCLPSVQHRFDISFLRHLLANFDCYIYCSSNYIFDQLVSVFDESGNFILYGTMLGIKGLQPKLAFWITQEIYLCFHVIAVINLATNKCVLNIGKTENARFLQLQLFQGTLNKSKAATTMEMEVASNPLLQHTITDPTLFCTAHKKNRFYMFSRREPSDLM